MVLPLTGGGHEGGGFTDVRTSINRRQNTVAQYIAAQPLLDLCKGTTQREGARVTLRWWDQTGIDWEKSKVRDTGTESVSDSGTDMDGEEARETESRAIGSCGAVSSGASVDEWEARQPR